MILARLLFDLRDSVGEAFWCFFGGVVLGLPLGWVRGAVYK